jgi:copper chaperone NosL
MSRAPLLLLLVPLTLVVGVVAIVAVTAAALPDGPVDLVWDKEACVFCRMHVGEPHFAAQLQTVDGEVFAFDDPGCLFEYEERSQPGVHAVYFHHIREQRWIAASAVRFVEISPTPMGYGLGAVDDNPPGSLDLVQARARVREKGQSR